MNNAKGMFFAILASTAFGLLPLFSLPLIHSGLESASILLYRFVISGAVVGLICIFKRTQLRITGRQFLILTCLSALYVLSATGLFMAYEYIPSGVATTIHFLYPVFVSGMMITIFKERGSKVVYMAMILSILGVGLLSWTNGEISIKGILLAASTIVSYSVYMIVVNRSSVKTLGSLTMAFYIFTIGSVMFSLKATIEGGIQPLEGVYQWKYVLLLSVISTVIPNIALVRAIKDVGPTITSILGSAEPMTAIAVGVLYFREDFSIRTLIGFGMIMYAVLAVILSKNRESMPYVRLKRYFYRNKTVE